MMLKRNYIMKKLMDDYGTLEKDVRALEGFALFLVALFYTYAIYFLLDRKIEEALKIVMPFGALISAVLVAKVASRLLTHNKIAREEDEQQDIVRITNHLTVVVSDLRNRVGFAVSSFRKGGHPLIVLTENAVAIEKRYEVLLEREAYLYFSDESRDLIGRMSGYVFGLAVFAKALTAIYQDKPNTIIPASEDTTRKKLIENLGSLLKDLDSLEGQIRQLSRVSE